jgi:hypothetical protein
MDIKDKIAAGERVYKSHRDITYYFEEGIIKDRLIIIFSAVNPPYKFSYNYLTTLEKLSCNKLFILDNFGDQGAYYIGENKDFSIETSVVSLISSFTKKYNLNNSDVITVGSSKGGFAALYFGIKYSYGAVISGGPQTKMGDFLYEQGKNFGIAEYIAGEMNEKNKHYLNNLLFDILPAQKELYPNLFIHVGIGDHHYKNHVTPLMKKLDEVDESIYSLNLEDYHSHDGIRKFFPHYLSKTLSHLLNVPTESFNPIKKIDIKIAGSKLDIICDHIGEEIDGLQFAFYVYKDGEILEKIFYTEKNTLSYHLESNGIYKCKVFVRNQNKDKFIQMSEEVVYKK